MTKVLDNSLMLQNEIPSPYSDKRVYTVDEIQNILGIGLSTAYKLIKTKKFHSVKVGHRIFISKKSFDEWLQI